MIHMDRRLLLVTALVFTIALVTAEENHKFCPQKCHCSNENNLYTLHCTSLNFIKNATPKELLSIVSLDVSHSSISLDKHLVKKLVNLERLDLSNNKLTTIKHFPQLPKLNYLNLRRNYLKTLPHKNFENLETLDVSHNYIQQIPKEVLKWKKLKRIYIDGNKFSCSSESLKIRDELLERHVQLAGNAKCNSPGRYYGKSWKTVFDLDGGWLEWENSKDYIADEPGSGDVSAEVNPWSTTQAPEETTDDFNFGSGEGDFEFQPSEANVEEDETYHDENTTEMPENPFEDGGSGDEENSEEDIFSTTEAIEPIITTKKSVFIETAPKPTEDLVDTISVSTVGPSDTYNNNSINEELGNVEAAKANESSLGTNIVLILLLFALVALLVYFIKKKKANRKRNERQKADDFEKPPNEIELLPKSSIINEKQNGNPETTPLMNGNGDVEKDQYEKDTAGTLNCTPVEMRKKDAANGTNNNTNSPPHSPQQEVLSVKVKASEIPDSVPKTPILVDRRKTSDGQTSVIPSPNQNV